jgi:oxaloacetate decarboxylase alpha subunit/pyruvate carboxylase subunit B
VAAAPVARPAAAAAKPAAVAPAQQAKPAAPAAPAASEAADGSGTPLKAPMPGLIIRYLKQVGDAVKKGEGVVVLEAMKMENALVAPCDGVVKAVKFASGDNVAKGATLVLIE